MSRRRRFPREQGQRLWTSLDEGGTKTFWGYSPVFGTPVPSGRLSREPLHEAADLARVRDAADLQVAGDDRPVAQQAAEQGLVELYRADPREADGGRAPADDAVDDEQLLRGDDDVRPVPPPHRRDRYH